MQTDRPRKTSNQKPGCAVTDPYDWEERAAIYEYDAGMTRWQAERKAIQEWKSKQQK